MASKAAIPGMALKTSIGKSLAGINPGCTAPAPVMQFLPAIPVRTGMTGAAIQRAGFRKISLRLIVMTNHARIQIFLCRQPVIAKIWLVAGRTLAVAVQAEVVPPSVCSQVLSRSNFDFPAAGVKVVAAMTVRLLLRKAAMS
jgi:hypothetical protein